MRISIKLFDELLSILKFILHIQISEYCFDCYDLQKKSLVI